MLVFQIVLILRFVLGGVYVGFQRSQFTPFCISSAAVLPLGISVVGADGAIMLFLLAKSMKTGSSERRNDVEARWRKILRLAMAGAGLWTAVSRMILPFNPGLLLTLDSS